MVIKDKENSKLKIWIFNQFAVMPDMAGPTRHFDLSEELVRHNFNITIFASDYNLLKRKYEKLRKFEFSKIEIKDGVKFKWVRTFAYKKNNFKRTLNVLSYALNSFFSALKSGDTNFVIASSPHIFVLPSVYFLSKIKKAKFIVELRDLWPQSGIDMGVIKEKSFISKLMFFIERFALKRASLVIVLANGSKEYLLKKGVKENKIIFIPNGVSEKYIMKSLKLTEQENLIFLKKFKDDFSVVYAGAFGEANALSTVLDAASIVQKRNLNVKFILIGDGPQKEVLKKIADEKKLQNIIFKESVSHNEIFSYISKCDAGLLTLKKAEVFRYGISPNKLFDYMAASIPIICAMKGEVGELIEKSGCGIVINEEDPEELASVIEKLKSLPEDTRREMGKKGSDFVLENFSREKLALVLKEALLNLE